MIVVLLLPFFSLAPFSLGGSRREPPAGAAWVDLRTATPASRGGRRARADPARPLAPAPALRRRPQRREVILRDRVPHDIVERLAYFAGAAAQRRQR